MEQTSQEKRRLNMRLAWVIGVLVVIWYVAAMFVVLQP